MRNKQTFYDRAEALSLRVGPQATRYSIVFLLLLFGAAKWTAGEAHDIEPWVSASPFFGWLYGPLGVQGTSIFFGVFEVGTGIAIALRPFFRLASAAGSAFAIVMFLSTLSFLVTTPGLAASPAAGFILKDFVLLGGAIWTLGESLASYQRRRNIRAARPTESAAA